MGTAALVTGATGFLGGAVVRELAAHGYDVTAAGRRADALPPGVPALLGDLTELATARRPVDVVIHCAALSTPWGRWSDFRHANVDGTAAVLEFARRNGVRRIVHVSSPSVYAAKGDRLGIREEDVPTARPLNGYIRSKREAEHLLQRAMTEPGTPEIVIIRPRGLIGRGDPSLAPHLLEANERVGIPLFRGGEHLVDLTPVESAARALRLAAEVPAAAGQVFNVSNGDPRSFRDLVEKLMAIVGREPRFRAMPTGPVYAIAGLAELLCAALPRRPEPPLTRYTVTTIAYSQTLNIDRARDILGFTPAATIEDGLASYAETLGAGASPARAADAPAPGANGASEARPATGTGPAGG